MVLASEVREGMIIRVEGQTYKVLEVEAKAGAAKTGGVVKTELVNVRGGPTAILGPGIDFYSRVSNCRSSSARMRPSVFCSLR